MKAETDFLSMDTRLPSRPVVTRTAPVILLRRGAALRKGFEVQPMVR
jgi:hypothetical protein